MSFIKEFKGNYSSKPSEYYEGARDELLEYIPSEVKFVLDVGCSNGNFGQMLKQKRNCTVWGVEPTLSAANEAEAKLDRVINQGFSSDLSDLAGVSFDAIFFNDVLEHLTNPEEALEASRKFLNKSGYVIASIPNVLFFPNIQEMLFQQDWRYRELGILDYTHLRFFTKKSIIRMFESCGFNVHRIEGINPFIVKRYQLINLFLFNHTKDWKYPQFAVVAQPK